jgi:uncharacterized coiled-coil protein SlyX
MTIAIRCQKAVVWLGAAFPLVISMMLVSTPPARAEDTNEEAQIRALEQQNAILQQRLEKQDQAIESLTEKVEDLEATNAAAQSAAAENAPPPSATGYNLGNVHVGAEGGLAYFQTRHDGFSANSDLRVDEARLFVDAPVWKEVYFHGESDLATREYPTLSVQLGELYLDSQDLSQLWGRDGQLNLRAGRTYIPFGEEYLDRYAIDDPLISHSASDIWGYGPGIELYGALGKFDYIVALQNDSGANGVQDFNGDKAVTGRIGFNPDQHWRFSVSAMRTGNLNVQEDQISSLWFGNEFLQPFGAGETNAGLFHYEMVEGDVKATWSSGHVSAFGGYGHYNDNSPASENGRDFFYYSVEGVQDLPQKFYAAARFSEVLSRDGMPILGLGNYGVYDDDLTTELWRLSLGLGYRFSENLLLKAEYSFEGGHDVGGGNRDHENFFGTEAAFKF